MLLYTVILFLWSNYILSIRGLLCPTVKPLHQPLLLFVIGDEPTTLRTAATISTDAALGITTVFIGTFTLFIGVLVGGLLFYCISKHQFKSSKTETSFYQQQQAAVPQQRAGPVYEEVVELKENVAYGPAQGIELKPCEAYVPVQHWLSIKTFFLNQQQHEHFKALMNSVKSICLLCIANLIARILQYLMIELLWSLTSSFLILIASKHHLMIHVTVIKLTLASFSGHSQILVSHSCPQTLVNQVEFLRLLRKTRSKKYGDDYCYKEVLCKITDLTISLVLTTLG